jgi:hypothetical protein
MKRFNLRRQQLARQLLSTAAEDLSVKEAALVISRWPLTFSMHPRTFCPEQVLKFWLKLFRIRGSCRRTGTISSCPCRTPRTVSKFRNRIRSTFSQLKMTRLTTTFFNTSHQPDFNFGNFIRFF